jgi:hypothetical protein
VTLIAVDVVIRTGSGQKTSGLGRAWAWAGLGPGLGLGRAWAGLGVGPGLGLGRAWAFTK